MNFIKNAHDACWLRIRESTRADDRLLSACRILIGLFVLLLYPAKNGWVTQLPQALYDPPILSLGSLFSGFPSGSFLQIIDTIAMVALCAFTLGVRTRIAAVAFTAAHLIGGTFAFSFGKIDHNILLSMTVFCFAFTNSGCFHAVLPDKPRTFRIRGETLLAILIAFGMFTAGLPKALIWVDFDLGKSGFLAWFFDGYYSLERQHLLAPLVFQLPAIMIESFDYIAVLFELSPFVMLLLGRRYWRGWVIFAMLFHCMCGLLLNIASYVHMPVYLTFVIVAADWKSHTLRRLCIAAFAAAIIVTGIHVGDIWTSLEFSSVQVVLLPTFEEQLYFYMVCWFVYLAIAVRNYLLLLQQPQT